MQDKKTGYTCKMIAKALGVALIFACASSSYLQRPASGPWAMASIIVFGQVGYWLFLPFVLFLGGVIAFRGSLAHSFLHWSAYVGLVVLSLGLMTLLSQIAFQGNESLSNFSTYQNAIHSYQGGAASGLFLSDKIGGGALGYVLSSLLLLANQALLWTLAIVFLIAGVVLLFFPFWKKTTLFLIRFFKAHHAKRAAQKETERLKQEALNQATLEEQNAPLEGDYSPLSRSNGPLPLNDAPVASPVTAIPAPKEEKEEASLSRSELYGEHRASPLPTAVEPTPEQLNHPFVSPNELVHSGLQEAVFTPDGEPAYSPNPTPSFPSPLSACSCF
jgi:hypothetical protein